MIEEWAAFDRQMFRLDVVSGESRTTYLTNGKTNEVFRFKPFTCELLSRGSADYDAISKLFKGYTLGGDSGKTMAYGLGPLWLYSKTHAKSVDWMAPYSKQGHSFLDYYVGYEVKFDPKATNIDWTLRFYFTYAARQFVEAIDWLSEPSPPESGEGKVRARAKLVTKFPGSVSDSVFHLPIGYGCRRSREFDHPLKSDIGLRLLHEGNPNQAVMEISTSRASSEKHDWESHQYSLSLLRGSRKLSGQTHVYFVAHVQSRDKQTSRLRRFKKVWSAYEDSLKPVAYTIDQQSDSCQVTHDVTGNHLIFDFPGQQEEEIITLGSDLILSWFDDNDDYHLLREDSVETTERLKISHFEKRVDKFMLTSKDGSVSWQGPISIVKTIHNFQFFDGELNTELEKLGLVKTHTVLTVFFYSKDFTTIPYKTVIDLDSKAEVDINFMHKQLDISSCFEDASKTPIVVKYPIESRDLARKMYAIEDIVKELFLINLLETTPIQPTQLSPVEIEFDSFFIEIKTTILDLPLTHIFKFTPGYKLSDNKMEAATLSMVQKFEPKVERCATACDYYNCLRFSYDAKTLRCLIELKKDACHTVIWDSSDLYEALDMKIESSWVDPDMTVGRHISSKHLLENLKRYAAAGPNDENGDELEKRQTKTPLWIRIESELMPGTSASDPAWFDLKPSSIEEDIDSTVEFAPNEGSQDSGGEEGEQERGGLQLQYNLLLESSEFMAATYASVSSSYEDCEHQCEMANCRSFSHCELKEECRITNLHKLEDIKSETRKNPGCQVYALDYLSKFEKFGRVLPPFGKRKTAYVSEARECAQACLNEPDFTCQGFVHCEGLDKKPSCNLQDRHVDNMSGPTSESAYSFSDRVANNGTSPVCSLYSRSYLPQFDTHIGKSIGGSPTGRVRNAGAETCAHHCIELGCVAFEVCLEQAGQYYRQACALYRQEMQTSSLVERQRCTTFVLSKNSQFFKARKDKPLPPILAEERETFKDDVNLEIFGLIDENYAIESAKGDSSNESSWSKFFSLLLGAAFGVGCATLWTWSERIHGIATSFVGGKFTG